MVLSRTISLNSNCTVKNEGRREGRKEGNKQNFDKCIVMDLEV